MEAFDTIYPDDINIPEPEWDPPAGAKHQDPNVYADSIMQQIEDELNKQALKKVTTRVLQPVKSVTLVAPFFVNSDNLSFSKDGQLLKNGVPLFSDQH